MNSVLTWALPRTPSPHHLVVVVPGRGLDAPAYLADGLTQVRLPGATTARDPNEWP
jgi:hypothetical protein